MIFRLRRIFYPVLGIALLTAAAMSQERFTVDAYKEYLSEHQDVSSAEVLSEHPSPLFLRSVAKQPQQPAYLDSAIQKLGLTPDEVDLLMDNGFLVTERLSRPSFFHSYSDVWHKDLPVFVSTDAILHAVHMSYDEVLKMTEMHELLPMLRTALDKMRAHFPNIQARYAGNDDMLPMLQDADLYVGITRALLELEPQLAYPANNEPLNAILTAIGHKKPLNMKLFSETPRLLDFSQFTVRGHYTDHPDLELYFQAMMWMGRTELMLKKPVQHGVPQQSDEDVQRMTIHSFLLEELIFGSGAESEMRTIEEYISFLVGESDNVTYWDLQTLRYITGFVQADELLQQDVLERFQGILEEKGKYGQRINSQILMSDPMNPEQLEPAVAFLVMGQRFIIDSYVLGSVVYDKIIHDGTKVRRMLPSPMDALFALGNNAAAQFLKDEFDRYNYAPNLMALRYLIDSYEEEYWDTNLYTMWLHAIRGMNSPESREDLPEFMQTAAWQQQKMNTQLASWAQLRHDNILYAKQSYSGGVTCCFPEGYVEPYPDVYSRIGEFARAAADLYDQHSSADELEHVPAFFTRFATVMDTLTWIAEKELNGTPITQEDVGFMQRMLYSRPICGEPEVYDGWYHDLFFAGKGDADDFVVADVHTAPTDESGNPVGWVYHVGTGMINTGVVIAPSVNGGLTAYTGAMMSFYEHVTRDFTRFTDDDWKRDYLGTDIISRPVWTNAYLANGEGGSTSPAPMLATVDVTGVEDVPVVAAATPVLHEVYPNPVSAGGTALLRFTLAEFADNVRLEVYDLTGKRVASLVNEPLRDGTFYVEWNGTNQVPSGTYLARLTANGKVSTQNIVLVR